MVKHVSSFTASCRGLGDPDKMHAFCAPRPPQHKRYQLLDTAHQLLSNMAVCARELQHAHDDKKGNINVRSIFEQQTVDLYDSFNLRSLGFRASPHLTSTSLDVMYMNPRSVLSTSATPGFCTLMTTSSPVFNVAAYTCIEKVINISRIQTAV